MAHLFTYGSLMCADIMQRVSGCRLQATEAVLHDFFCSEVVGEEYPGILPRPESTVTGILYLDLPDEAVKRLDLFEGEMYERLDVEVVPVSGETAHAMVYAIKPEHRHRLTNTEWSYARFLERGKSKFEAAYLGFTRI